MRQVFTFRGIVPAFTFLLVCMYSHAQGIQYDKVEFITEKVGPNVYVFTGSSGTDPGHPEGAGGRVGVLAGPDGVLMVDASYAPLADKLKAAIRKISLA